MSKELFHAKTFIFIILQVYSNHYSNMLGPNVYLSNYWQSDHIKIAKINSILGNSLRKPNAHVHNACCRSHIDCSSVLVLVNKCFDLHSVVKDDWV